ncbi:MAG: hypothetical protein KDB80_04880, partial [Planctomycetes bacterium]|nr:hypothetical protein [Planctomycetota bacterium]
MCLENRAHGLRTAHPIFRGPLDPKLEFEPLPKNDPYADRFGARTPTWLVQVGEARTENDFGVIGDAHGFEDSPDCERICGGLNTKEPNAIAIGRQANLLHWGFYAAPDRMTESARRVFLNAIVWMRQFDGARPIVPRESRSRAWLQTFIDRIRQRHAAGDRTAEVLGYYYGRFPPDVALRTGGDARGLQKWHDRNIEFVVGGDNLTFSVDEDVAKLGISNRSPELLDWIRKRLKRSPRHEVARRLAARYLGDDGQDARTAIAWIEANRDRAFF